MVACLQAHAADASECLDFVHVLAVANFLVVVENGLFDLWPVQFVS